MTPLSFERLAERGEALARWIAGGGSVDVLADLDRRCRHGRCSDFPGRPPGPERRDGCGGGAMNNGTTGDERVGQWRRQINRSVIELSARMQAIERALDALAARVDLLEAHQRAEVTRREQAARAVRARKANRASGGEQ